MARKEAEKHSAVVWGVDAELQKNCHWIFFTCWLINDNESFFFSLYILNVFKDEQADYLVCISVLTLASEIVPLLLWKTQDRRDTLLFKPETELICRLALIIII